MKDGTMTDLADAWIEAAAKAIAAGRPCSLSVIQETCARHPSTCECRRHAHAAIEAAAPLIAAAERKWAAKVAKEFFWIPAADEARGLNEAADDAIRAVQKEIARVIMKGPPR